ncbi:hypothetical protein [Nonomuraea sp. C10]|uniref:hypothetical protein n=1 Tax=Nonomuraea sp. C10 TaxID=2600577 RepID=UPI001C9D59E4|nr:hypothetical protein [Nonomuraea sp. C10]
MLDAVLGLLIVAALPLAIVAIPNTVSVVAELLPAGIDRVGLMRAHGLALPAMMLAVPLAAMVLRRVKAAHLLVAGLALLAVADAAGGYADSAFVVGVLRVAHGVGAGLLVPATLVAVWDRPRWLRGLWAGTLALSLLGAQALALWPLAGATEWRITLQPYPLLSGIALALAAVYLMLWSLRGRPSTPGPRPEDRSRVLLAIVPAAGVAAVAIGAASQDWHGGLMITLAALAMVGLLALASIGARESRTLAYTMVAVGVVLLPSVAQVTYVEMGGMGGPGLKGLWVPFCVAGVLGVVAAVAVRVSAASSQWLTQLGLLAMVAGLCSVRVLVPSAEGLVLVVPFTLLTVGASVALTAALADVGSGAAMFGLALCFPGVLAGYLLGTGMQKTLLDQSSRQEFVDSYVGVLHLWALVGGFLAVAVIVLVSVMSRRPPAADGGAGATIRTTPAEDGQAGGGGEMPPVPPPAQSPEGGA